MDRVDHLLIRRDQYDGAVLSRQLRDQGIIRFIRQIVFIGYMNVYNMDEEKPITISGAIKIMLPYFAIISLTWLLLIIGWYIIGLPIGPGVYPTI